jgi:hypothetical protein
MEKFLIYLNTVEINHGQELGADNYEANEGQYTEDYHKFSIGSDATAQYDENKCPQNAQIEGQLKITKVMNESCFHHRAFYM